jgi:tRNA 2-selenouridine synthase
MASEAAISLPFIAWERVEPERVALVIDVRSPSEFEADHVPGAINAPLFDDEQRERIGTLYARESPESAFDEARARVIERVEALVREVASASGWHAPAADLGVEVERLTRGGLATIERTFAPSTIERLPERAVLACCWRGGLRSRSVVALLRELGHERVVGIAGGYKSYRRATVAALEGWNAPRAYALRGLTGVGKTLVLRELERLRPSWTVDLEALAGHRSSVLGAVGFEPCSQKTFESRLAARLARGFGGPVVLEGESRKVGDAIVPRRVWAALEGATSIELTAPLERRVQVLIDDYLAHPDHRGELEPEVAFLEARLGHRGQSRHLVELLRTHRERELVEALLELYYDPLYRHSEQGRAYATSIDASDPARAAREVATWIESAESR